MSRNVGYGSVQSSASSRPHVRLLSLAVNGHSFGSRRLFSSAQGRPSCWADMTRHAVQRELLIASYLWEVMSGEGVTKS